MTHEELEKRRAEIHEQSTIQEKKQSKVFLLIVLAVIGFFAFSFIIAVIGSNSSTKTNTVAANTPTPKIYNAQVISDATNNELDDNSDKASNYKGYIDITEADFIYTGNSYKFTLKTVDPLPKTTTSNDVISFNFEIMDKNKEETVKNAFMLTLENTKEGYNFVSTLSDGNEHGTLASSKYQLQGNYSINGNIVTVDVPKDVLEATIPISPDSLQWKVQTQYEDVASDTDKAANNFLPNNQDSWIDYK